MWALDRFGKASQHAAHAFQHHRQLVQYLATAEFLGVMDHHVYPQDALALVLDFQGQATPFRLAHRQVIAGRLHSLDHFCLLASPCCPMMRAMRLAEDHSQLLEVQRLPGAVDEILVHLVQRCAPVGTGSCSSAPVGTPNTDRQDRSVPVPRH